MSEDFDAFLNQFDDDEASNHHHHKPQKQPVAPKKVEVDPDLEEVDEDDDEEENEMLSKKPQKTTHNQTEKNRVQGFDKEIIKNQPKPTIIPSVVGATNLSNPLIQQKTPKYDTITPSATKSPIQVPPKQVAPLISENAQQKPATTEKQTNASEKDEEETEIDIAQTVLPNEISSRIEEEQKKITKKLKKLLLLGKKKNSKSSDDKSKSGSETTNDKNDQDAEKVKFSSRKLVEIQLKENLNYFLARFGYLFEIPEQLVKITKGEDFEDIKREMLSFLKKKPILNESFFFFSECIGRIDELSAIINQYYELEASKKDQQATKDSKLAMPNLTKEEISELEKKLDNEKEFFCQMAPVLLFELFVNQKISLNFLKVVKKYKDSREKTKNLVETVRQQNDDILSLQERIKALELENNTLKKQQQQSQPQNSSPHLQDSLQNQPKKLAASLFGLLGGEK